MLEWCSFIVFTVHRIIRVVGQGEWVSGAYSMHVGCKKCTFCLGTLSNKSCCIYVFSLGTLSN